MDRKRRALAVWLVFACAAGAETTARVEDWLRHDISPFVTPERERDLVLHDELGIRGRPNGRFKQWRLNQFGFRNSDMSEVPGAGGVRVMALGASETFGLFEPPGKEYPAQLSHILNASGTRAEVVNAAVAGLTLRGIHRLWDGWASRFGPDIALVYPTPAFYLGEQAPRYPGPPGKATAGPPPWMPRMLERARDRFEYPAFVQHHRVRRALAAATADKPLDWFFHTVPTDRLTQFQDDLRQLVRAITARGTSVFILTHATAFHNPPTADEIAALEGWRSVRPKAAANVLLDFEDASRQATLALQVERQVTIVDLAAHMNGQRQWFAEDYLHFNEAGARVAADLIARHIAVRAVAAAGKRHAVQ